MQHQNPAIKAEDYGQNDDDQAETSVNEGQEGEENQEEEEEGEEDEDDEGGADHRGSAGIEDSGDIKKQGFKIDKDPIYLRIVDPQQLKDLIIELKLKFQLKKIGYENMHQFLFKKYSPHDRVSIKDLKISFMRKF